MTNTVTILARLQTRLNQGPGLLHEVRCEPFNSLYVGDGQHKQNCHCGEGGLGMGCSPQRDWSLCISTTRFSKRPEIVDAALIRFTAQDRQRHMLRTWYPIGSLHSDINTLKLLGNFSFGGFHGSIAEARAWLENTARLPDYVYRLYEWRSRTGQVLLPGYPPTEKAAELARTNHQRENSLT